MGGIGKTAFALKLADGLTSRYPDAQIYLDLNGVSSTPLIPSQAMAHVIRTFHPDTALPEGETELASLYRSVLQGRQVLILLDNAASQSQVASLIPPKGNFLLLTSWLRFYLPGLRAQDLGELPLKDARDLLLRISPRMGVQADSIAKICAGLPFALLQAAGTLSSRPDLQPARYAQRLAQHKERLGLVTASLRLSYKMLSKELARRWRTLAVFPAKFNASAAKAVWDIKEEESDIALGELVRCSLLQGQDEIYWLHDLARAFAENLLQKGERVAAEKRHAKFYLIVAGESAETFMKGDQAEGLRVFDDSFINIVTGFGRAAQASATDNSVAELATYYPIVCQPFFSLRLHSEESLGWLNTALTLARKSGTDLYVSTILNQIGLELRRIGRHREALAHFQESLSTAAALDNVEIEAIISGNLGHELLFLGETEKAHPILSQALSKSQQCGDHHGETVALAGLERLYFDRQDFPRAIDFAQKWLATSQISGQRQSEGEALGNMGVTYMNLENPYKAIECFAANLEIARELGDRLGEAACMGNLGWAHAHLGNLEEAATILRSRIDLSRSLCDVRGEAESSWNLGTLLEDQGDLVQAAKLMQVMVDYKVSIGHPDAESVEAEIGALRARIHLGQLPPSGRA